jgi:hypothetical protein
MRQRVSSREYKIMLNKERFIGSEAVLLERAKEFWVLFKDAIDDRVLDTDKSLNKIEKRRTIRFYDTEDRCLRANNYAFRERIDLSSGDREVTLKFRHPDRYVAQDRNMHATDRDAGETKFEEDIKPSFEKLYSFSTKQEIEVGKELNKLNDPGRLFPDFKKRLPGYRDDERIVPVGGFTVSELVVTGADFEIRKEPKREAECALIAWYNANGKANEPAVVEFSFRYGDKEEEYDGETAQRAFDVFGRLQNLSEDWIDSEGPTKTAFIYSIID